jgi:peptidylprolyl isomerase
MVSRTLTVTLALVAGLAALAACNGGGAAAGKSGLEWIEIEPGLSYVELAEGAGDAVASGDFVQIHYAGWYEADSDSLYETPGDSLVKFDSSLDRGEPIAFPLGRSWVIPGWEKGVPGTRVGGKRKLRIGPALAYGMEGRPPVIPGGATLVFDIEIVGKPTVDVTVLEAGTGPVAEPGDRLSVHYTGWVWENGEKGKEFDSSIGRGRPFQFTMGAGQVIQGWDFGLTGMAEGSQARLIIPPEMGYGSRGAGGAIPPNATLCFEVELVAVEKP